MTANEWSADVPVSMPDYLKNPGLVPMFGFTFTEFGLAHDLNQAEWEELKQPDYAPLWHQVMPTRYENGG